MPFIPDEHKRTGSMRVRLSPEMLDRFEALAKRYGMPPSTLAAFAIARFVQAEDTNRMVVMDAARQQVKTLGEQLTDERMDKLFGPMLKNMLSVFQGDQLAEEGGRDETPKTGG